MSYRKIPKIKGYKRNEVIAFVKMKLEQDHEWVIRAFKKLFDKQSKEEITKRRSIGRNQFGFSKNDAPFMTRLGKNINIDKLPKSEIKRLGMMLEKYAVQLILLSDQDKLKSGLDAYYNKIKLVIKEPEVLKVKYIDSINLKDDNDPHKPRLEIIQNDDQEWSVTDYDEILRLKGKDCSLTIKRFISRDGDLFIGGIFTNDRSSVMKSEIVKGKLGQEQELIDKLLDGFLQRI